MSDQHAIELTQVHDMLKQFLATERQAYAGYNKYASYDRNARRARSISHRVMATLVPRYRAFDKLLKQPTAGAMYAFAPANLASVLVSNFIGKTSLPDTHPVWQLPVTGHQLKALVESEPVRTEIWYTQQETHYPGITQVLDSNAATLRDLRTAYLSNATLASAKEQQRLRKLMAYLKGTLKPADYNLLVNNMKLQSMPR